MGGQPPAAGINRDLQQNRGAQIVIVNVINRVIDIAARERGCLISGNEFFLEPYNIDLDQSVGWHWRPRQDKKPCPELRTSHA